MLSNLQVYEEALNVLPSVKMFSLFVKFWSDVACPESMMHKVGLELSEFSLFLKNAYEKAETTGCLIEDLACQYISFYLQAGKIKKARKVAEKLCTGKLSEAASVWLLRISIERNYLVNKASFMSKDDLDYIFRLLESALNRLSLSKAEGLWFMVHGLSSFSNVFSTISSFSILPTSYHKPLMDIIIYAEQFF